jgi:hypothetical protein
MELTVHKGSGTSTGSDIYLNGRCKADFSDIRFTNADGTTLLDYWIENYTSSSAIIWVELDSLPASPNSARFYIYYGNQSALSASNGSNTFILFDDFSGTSLDTSKWHTFFKDGGGSIFVSNGVCTIQCNPGVWASANLYSDAQFGINTRLRAYVEVDDASAYNHDMGFKPPSEMGWTWNNIVRIVNRDAVSKKVEVEALNGGLRFNKSIDDSSTDWTTYEFYIGDKHAVLDVSPALDMSVWARAEAGDTYGVRTLKIDWIALSNYTQHGPTFDHSKSVVLR